jgi:hypothetical protein
LSALWVSDSIVIKPPVGGASAGGWGWARRPGTRKLTPSNGARALRHDRETDKAKGPFTRWLNVPTSRSRQQTQGRQCEVWILASLQRPQTFGDQMTETLKVKAEIGNIPAADAAQPLAEQNGRESPPTSRPVRCIPEPVRESSESVTAGYRVHPHRPSACW